MILAPNTLPEEVAFALEAAVTALKAAADDDSEVARFGLEEVERCMGYIGAVGGSPLTDIETWADREEELQALYAELAEEGAEDDLPPIIQDEGPLWDTWGEAA